MENRIFNQTNLLDFLDTEQSGSAHKASGLTLKSFFTSIGVSLTFAVIEVVIFSILRQYVGIVYRTRSLDNLSRLEIQPNCRNMFSWLPPLISNADSTSYLSNGLDAYFSLRFLHLMMRLFFLLSIINNIMLIPVNMSGSEHTVSFFDRASISNIAPERNSLYTVHFIDALLTIVLFHYVIIEELRSHCKIRKHFLSLRRGSQVVMLEKVPLELQNHAVFYKLLEGLPGGIKNLWFMYDIEPLRLFHKEFVSLRAKLEKMEYMMIAAKARSLVDISFESNCGTAKCAALLSFTKLKTRFKFLERRTYAYTVHAEKLTKLHEKIKSFSSDIFARQIPYNGKAFIQFNDPRSAHIINQVVLFEDHNKLNHCELDLNPNDIIWDNLIQERNWAFKCKSFSARLLAIIITIFWVLPVSVVGVITQLPYLARFVPFLQSLNTSPIIIRAAVASVLPTICLAALMEIVLWIFSQLSKLKGKVTGSKCQLDLQNWYFMFLFVQLFLIVTISSGATAIFENLVNNPVSIPTLLAKDLPKASNFFHSFLIVRSAIYMGNTLLQPKALFMRFVMPFFFLETPRNKLERIRFDNNVSWGTVYPTFTVFGSIGIVYSIISPLILIFASLSFFLISIGIKYNLANVYNPKNESETFGRLYPTALLQLYSGIYCLELALLGIFILQECQILSLLMVVMFALTVVINNYLRKKYANASLAYINLSDVEKIHKDLSIDPKVNTGPNWTQSVTEKLKWILPELPNLEECTTFSIPKDEKGDEAEEGTLETSFFPKTPPLSLMLPRDAMGFCQQRANKLRSYGIHTVFEDPGMCPYQRYEDL